MKKYLVYAAIAVSFSAVLIARVRRTIKPKERVYGMHDIVSFDNFDEKVYGEKRRAEVVKLVEKAVAYLQKNNLGESLHAFSHDKSFVKGAIYLFAYDYNGVCLAHGKDNARTWQNRITHRDAFGVPYVKMMIDKAKDGGGWVNYQRENTAKLSYVKGVNKDGKKILIGAGYYPVSKRDAVVALVRGAVEHFNVKVAEGNIPRTAFSEFSYPLGKFVVGDLYLYALRFDGLMMAQGDRPGLIGTNALNYQDSQGKFINRDIIKKLKQKDTGGVWIEYISKGAPKKAYAEKVTDKNGKKYFIACGYYTDTNREKVVNLVKRGYTYLEKHGLSQAARKFTDRRDKKFRYGDLWLFLYDLKGKCWAHGKNADYVGTNRYDVQDEDGKYFVRDFIKKAKSGGGWTDHKEKGSYRFVYVEEVELGADKFVIGCGIFPISKPESMQLLVKGAAGFLRDEPREKAFEEFIKRDGRFVKGDLEIFVFDMSGLCYVYGNDYTMIWKDLFDAKDEAGKPYVKLIINTAKEGSGVVVYKENQKFKAAYVMQVEKNGKTYAIGSSFYPN